MMAPSDACTAVPEPCRCGGAPSNCSTIMERIGSLAEREIQQQLEPAADIPDLWPVAVEAAEAKKASKIVVLDLREITSFTEFFVICTGSNQRQIQAICDEIQSQLKQSGSLPLGVEGYEQAEWVLADFGDFIVHIFSERAREYYDLERLWKNARKVHLETKGNAGQNGNTAQGQAPPDDLAS
jgi:ribosome-associated protein